MINPSPLPLSIPILPYYSEEFALIQTKYML